MDLIYMVLIHVKEMSKTIFHLMDAKDLEAQTTPHAR